MESIIEKKIEIKMNEVFYYLFLLIMTIAKGLGLYEGIRFYNICLLLACFFVLLKIFCEKYTLWEFIVTVGLIFIAFAVYRCAGDQAALIYTAMVVGMKNISLKRVLVFEGYAWGICFVLRSFMGMTGLYRGMALVHEKLGLGPIIRWSFGYPHPNVLQITYAVLVALILYNLNYSGKKLYKLSLMLFLGNILIFIYSVSYTGFILTTGLLCVNLYFSVREKRSRAENVLIQCILPFCLLFAVGLPLAMEKGSILNGLDSFMNKLFNTRFLASRVYMYEGVKLFGRDVSNISFALDCSYVYLLMKGGIILFAIIMIGYFILVRRYLKLNRRRELAIIITFFIAGVSEPFLFNTSFKNITFFFLGELLYEILEGSHRKVFDTYKRKIGIWDSHRYGFSIPTNLLSDFICYIKYIYKRKYKLLLTGGAIGAIVAVIIYIVFLPIPGSIYVAVGNTDCNTRKEYYLTNDQLDNSAYLVYEYQGEKVPMYQFEGNTVAVEVVRDELSCVVFGGILSIVVLLVILVTKFKRKRGCNSNELTEN